jgi:hypothetical protein
MENAASKKDRRRKRVTDRVNRANGGERYRYRKGQ